MDESEKLMKAQMNRLDRLASFDSEMLQTIPVRSNSITSGTYLMQIWFPKLNLETQEVVLNCENGQIGVLKFGRNGETKALSLNGDVVSWIQEGAGYEANPRYVGLLDGNQMWGRVYGWGLGDQSVGLWRIYPKLAAPSSAR